MPNLPPLPLIDGALFIDNSGWIETMSTCHRYLQYKNLNKRVTSGEKAALNFGSAIHLAVELRYARYQNKLVDEAYYNDLSSIFTDLFNEHPSPSDDWRSLNWAMEMTKKYNDRFSIEDFNLLKYEKPVEWPSCGGTGHTHKPAEPDSYIHQLCPFCLGTGLREAMVEVPFAVKLFDWKGTLNGRQAEGDERWHKDGKWVATIPIIYSGRIDLPIMKDNQLFVMDHKTTSMMGQPFWDEQRVSPQHLGYCWAFEQTTGQRPTGYVVNAVRTKDCPQYVLAGKDFKSKDGKKTSPADWWQQTFQRDIFPVTQSKLDEWKNNTIDLVEEFFFHYQRDFMPQKKKWCSSYGRCPYYEVCLLAPEDRGLILASGEFSDNKWTPLNQPTQTKQ